MTHDTSTHLHLPDPPARVPLADLAANGCRFPFGDRHFLFCNEPQQEGSSYCCFHHAICWVKPILQPARGEARGMSELERLRDRVDELEDILGLNLKLPNEIGLTPTEMKCVGALIKRDIVSRDMIFSAIYGGRPECDQPDIKIIDVYLSKVRRKLGSYGYSIKNRFSVGYYMDAETRNSLKVLCEAAA